MKNIFIFSLIFLLASCSKSVSSDKLVYRDGFVFEINQQQPFSGTSVSYHPNGQIKEKVNYIDGKLGLFYESYFDNGQTQFIKNYDKQGKRDDGKSLRYFKNGSIEEESTFENGLLNGSYLYFKMFSKYFFLIFTYLTMYSIKSDFYII